MFEIGFSNLKPFLLYESKAVTAVFLGPSQFACLLAGLGFGLVGRFLFTYDLSAGLVASFCAKCLLPPVGHSLRQGEVEVVRKSLDPTGV